MCAEVLVETHGAALLMALSCEFSSEGNSRTTDTLQGLPWKPHHPSHEGSTSMRNARTYPGTDT